MRELKTAFKLTLVFVIIVGIIYPLVTTVFGKIIFPGKSAGSLVYNNGTVVGSTLIGQNFTDTKWFMGRPSAVNYDATKSGGTNQALSNPAFKAAVNKNIDDFLKNNPTAVKADVPEDIVTASASGLDPEISVEAALLQISRVAKGNSLTEDVVKTIVNNNIEHKFLGIFGEDRVNVLKLNLLIQDKTKM
jgi:potassium-transporting ATPase KdpC subunit